MFLLLLALALTGSAQAERLPIKSYTTEDGLAPDRISRIKRDSRGFLWFCTGQGISRFDGYKFTPYTEDDGLPDRNVTHLLETSEGVYWVATLGGGLCRLNPIPSPKTQAHPPLDNPRHSGFPSASDPRFVVYKLSDDPRTQYVHYLIEDREGTIWCGTGGGLFRIEKANGQWTFTFVDIGLPVSRYGDITVSTLLEGKRGELWIGAGSGLYRRYADGRVERYTTRDGLPGDDVQSLVEDKEGQLWVGTTLGLCRIVFDGGGRAVVTQVYKEKEGLAGNTVTSLLQSSDGKLWIGTHGGLSVLYSADKEERRVFAYKAAHGISGIDINTLAEDRDGNLWIGSESGAMRLARHGLITYDEKDGFKDTKIGSVVEDTSGQIYAIDSKGFINRFDGNRFISVKPGMPAGIAFPGVGWYQISFQDHLGKWWVPTLSGLCRFPRVPELESIASMRPEVIYTTKDGMNGNEVFRVFEDSRRDIWVSTMDGPRSVLSRWERATETFHRYSPSDGIPEAGPTAFGEDRSGNIWIGFFTGNLVRYAAGRFSPVTQADGLPAGMIRGLYSDSKGRLWIATGNGGLARVDDPDANKLRFVTYTTATGLSSNQVNCITEDRLGRIYVGTARGIDRIDPGTDRIAHYSVADGLANIFVYVAFRDRQGSLWFGTHQGLSRITPEPQSNPPGPLPAVLIRGLRIAGFAYPISDLGETDIPHLELNASQNQIEIDFFSFNFSPGLALRYQYRLEGSDQDWKPLTDQRTVNYANLAPGTYRFLVRAVSAYGTVSQSPATMDFTILPPLWQQWWFLTLAAILIAVMIFAFERYRASRVKVIKESEDRFRTLAETASDAIITIDEDSTIIFVNPAAESVFGYTVAEMMGSNLTMLMPEYLRHLHQAGFNKYIETGKRHLSWEAIELPGLHKSGREIPLEISFGEFTRNERHFFTGVARDITERKRAEEALIRSREERLIEIEQVRRRIATDLHDDIGSSLTQISILSEVARRELRDQSSQRPLSMIASASRELVDSMSDIVWAINPQKDHLSDLIKRMRLFASDIFTARNIKFRFNAPGHDQDIRMGANIRREVFLIFKESVNNLVRHSGCTEAEIEFRVENDQLALRVSDNGSGFDLSRQSEGHGMVSMRERARHMGGDFEVESGKGRGTIVNLKLPLQP